MIFVDTGPIVGVVYKKDQSHSQAKNLWPKIRGQRCITTSVVVVEVVNILTSRIGGEAAASWGRDLYKSSGWLTILRPSQDDELSALNIVGKYADHKIGMADAISVVLMKKHGIRKLCTFDPDDFKPFGFDPL